MPNNKDFFKFIKETKCPNCKNKFEESDINIIRSEDDGITISQIVCKKCSKSFALGLFGLDKEEIKALTKDEVKAKPISYDEILNFHHFLNSFEKNFSDYLKKKELK